MVEAAGAEPAGRTSYLDMILVNGEATGAPDKRVAGGAVPPTRPKQAAPASSDYLRTRSLKPEWRGSGLLTRWPVDRNHSRPPKHIEIGPVTVAAERAGLLSRQRKLIAGSNPAWSSNQFRNQFRVCTPIGRGNALRAHSVAVRVGPDAPIASRFREASIQLRYASGEAARLSIGREGFDLPTERQFLKQQGVAQPGQSSCLGSRRPLVRIQPP